MASSRHGGHRRSIICRGLVLAALVAGGTANAQPKAPTAADRETARALMDEGRARTQKGDKQGALAAFKGADAIMHVPTTGLAVAKAQVALGLLVDARDTALGVTRLPQLRNESAVMAESRKAADELVNELGPRIPTLHVVIKAPDGVTPEVVLDDVAVPYEALVAPRRVNPGHHVVVAKVGSVERRAESDLDERDAKTVSLEFPADAKPAAVAAQPTPHVVGDQRPTKKGTSPLVYIGIGVGGAGLLAGLGAGIYSISKTSSAKEGCVESLCPASTHGDLDSAATGAAISNIGFIVAGAGAATAVIGFLLGGGRAQAKPTATARPYVSAGHVGMTGEF